MADALSGQRLTSERFHVYLLLVLGLAFLGAGITIIGLVSESPVVVAIGAGVVVAAGLISVLFALMGSRLRASEESEHYAKDDTFRPRLNDPGPERQRPAWPPKTARRSQI
jgi:hypothetical protein